MRLTRYLVTLLAAVYASVSAAETVVYVDTVGNNGPASWNNINLNSAGTSLLLRGTNEVYTGVRLQVIKSLANNNVGVTNLIGDATPFIPAGDSTCYGTTTSSGEILLDGLTTNVAYTFTFLGTRAGTPSPSDIREGLYSVQGATTNAATLDALGNTSQVAVVSATFPRADGTLTLAFSKGPNNNNSSGFFYIAAFKMTFEPPANPATVALQTPVFFDAYGNNSRQFGWNNVNFMTTAVTSPVYDASNRLTSVTFQTTYAAQSPNVALTLPALSGEALPFAPAGGSVVYGGTARTRFSALLSGLDTNTAYALTFFGCRSGVTDNRDTFFTVTGRNTKSRTLNVSSNSNRVAAVSGLLPKANGTLDITVNIGPENNEPNRYFYLNAFKLEPVTLPAPDPNVVFLDASGDNASTANGWNNCSFNALTTYSLNLTNNTPSGILLRILTAGDGGNSNGTLTPSELAAEFAPVRNNNALGHTRDWVQSASVTNPAVPVVSARFSNLSTNIPYAFTFYAFREDATAVRETRCLYVGATTNYSLMNVGISSNRVAVADGIYPAPDGTITMELTTGPNQTENTGFFYIAGLKLTYPDGGIPFDPVNAVPAGKKLLFFGNSYSLGSNVPAAVGQIAAGAGYPEPLIVSDLMNGEDLAYHITQVSSNAAANVSHPDINLATWDHVILQGYSTEATSLGDPAAFRSNAVTLFQSVARHASGNGSGASAILFQTWARAPENTDFYPALFPSAAAMQSEVTASYDAACSDLRAAEGTYAARVAPVGEAFAGEAFADDLYAEDNHHASLLGARLAALVLFRTIYNDTVSDIPYAAVSNSAAAGLSSSDWSRLTARADSVSIGGFPSPFATKLRERFYIDAAANDAANRWNNVDLSAPRAAGLITTDGRQPGALLSVRKPLQGLNRNGTPAPAGAAAEFAPAGTNSNFGNTVLFQNRLIPQGELILHGLSTNRLYAFTFFASRMGAAGSRETRYTATGATAESVLLEPVDNTSEAAATAYLAPRADGTLTVTVEPGPGNTDPSGFYHLGAFRMDSKWSTPFGTMLLVK